MIAPNSKTLLIAQIVAHLSLIPMIIYGTWWMWAISVGVYFLNGCFGMTMTYHRLLSHKSWKCPKVLEYLFTLFATIGLTGPAISWVAIHRKHHAFMDTDKDPHSPIHKGWFYAHFLSMFAKVDVKYAVHLCRDKFYTFQHDHYFTINLIYATMLWFIDPFAIIYAWLVPAAILWNGGSLIVSTSHRSKGPHNDILLAVLVWGEGYHAEHHDKPNAKRFGKYDIGGIIIEYIERIFTPSSVGE